jgi:hypothetical protein
MLAELGQHGAQELQQVRAIAPEGIAMVSMVEVLVRSWRSSSRMIAIWSSGCAMERTPVLWRAGLLPRGGGPVLGGALQASRLRALCSGLITVVVSLAHLLPFSCGLVTRTLDDRRPLGPPRLLFHQRVKSISAGAGDPPVRLFFPRHFIPAPFFNEGTARVGI